MQALSLETAEDGAGVNSNELTIEQEQEAFDRQLDGLKAEHAGRAVLMKGGEVLGIFEDLQAAYAEGVARFGPHSVFLTARIESREPRPVSVAWELGVMFG